MADAGAGRIGSVVGRYWAMDRDRRWDRIQRAYDLLVHGRAEHRAQRPCPQRARHDRFQAPVDQGRRARQAEGAAQPHRQAIARALPQAAGAVDDHPRGREPTRDRRAGHDQLGPLTTTGARGALAKRPLSGRGASAVRGRVKSHRRPRPMDVPRRGAPPHSRPAMPTRYTPSRSAAPHGCRGAARVAVRAAARDAPLGRIALPRGEVRRIRKLCEQTPRTRNWGAPRAVG